MKPSPVPLLAVTETTLWSLGKPSTVAQITINIRSNSRYWSKVSASAVTACLEHLRLKGDAVLTTSKNGASLYELKGK